MPFRRKSIYQFVFLVLIPILLLTYLLLHTSYGTQPRPKPIRSTNCSNSEAQQKGKESEVKQLVPCTLAAPAPLRDSDGRITIGYGHRRYTLSRAELDKMSRPNLENLYFAILEHQQINCTCSRRLGLSDDGGWDVCFSYPFNLSSSKPCVAFSFGVETKWQYDDELADTYHCNVFMYDPSLYKINDHQRRSSSWFYRIGLSSKNNIGPNGWQMRTLCWLFELRGYGSDKIVDLLKIDIEYSEWDAFEKAIEDGCLKRVKQLLFESHTAEFHLVRKSSDFASMIRIWVGLFEIGFRTWKWHQNPFSNFYNATYPSVGHRACCYEHYMINVNFLY